MALVLALAAIPFAPRLWETVEAGDGVGLTAPPPPPGLWARESAACPAASTAMALGLAHQHVVLACDKGARRDFCPADGIAAAKLHDRAAACFHHAGDEQASAVQAAHAAALRAELSRGFRTHQLRLEHALRSEDWATARQAVSRLRPFVRERPGAYLAWLDRVARHVAADEGSDE